MSAVSTLRSGTRSVPYMVMTLQAIPCPAPVLPEDFDSCQIPGGIALWENGGFYSPGECFLGYRAMCTQSTELSNGWSIRPEETAVRCVPVGYECNDPSKDQKYAISDYEGTTLSAPAFEIRWRSQDLATGPRGRLPPGVPTTSLEPVTSTVAGQSDDGDGVTPTPTPTPTLASTSSGTPLTTSASGLQDGNGSNSGSGFSTGSIAGIVVGSILTFLAVMMGMVIFFIRRRRQQRLQNGPKRIPDEAWNQHGHQTAQHPVELEHQEIEPKELPADTLAGPREAPSQTFWALNPSVSHISVNVIPVEAPADPVPASKYPAGPTV